MIPSVDLPLPVETSRLRLRPFAPGDLAAVSRRAGARGRPSLALLGAGHRGRGAEAIERRIARAPETGVALVAELAATGEFAGDVTLTLGEHRQAEIGFVFDPAHQGHGYATEAAAAVVALAFDDL